MDHANRSSTYDDEDFEDDAEDDLAPDVHSVRLLIRLTKNTMRVLLILQQASCPCDSCRSSLNDTRSIKFFA